MKRITHLLRSLAVLAAFGAAAASAQEAQEPPSLVVELNALQPSERGCRFTFVVTNRLGGELASAAFELVLFDKAGMVSRITIVDFKDLPEGKTKVRQFDFAGIDCNNLGRILVNDATECTGTGVEPKACIRHLKTETLGEIVFGV
jgi:hypothetical protein